MRPVARVLGGLTADSLRRLLMGREEVSGLLYQWGDVVELAAGLGRVSADSLRRSLLGW